MFTSMRAHAALAAVVVPLALGAPLHAFAASPTVVHGSPSVVAGATVRSAPMRIQDEETEAEVSADRLDPAAGAPSVVSHVHARLTKYDEATVTWSVSGPKPSAFVVELVPFGNGPTVQVGAGAGARRAVVSKVDSATRFTVRVIAVNAKGVEQQPVTGNSVLTKSMVAAAVATAASATMATDAAERADRAARRADARITHAGGKWGPLVAAAARAHRHADRLREIAATATREAARARSRIVHIS